MVAVVGITVIITGVTIETHSGSRLDPIPLGISQHPIRTEMADTILELCSALPSSQKSNDFATKHQDKLGLILWCRELMTKVPFDGAIDIQIFKPSIRLLPTELLGPILLRTMLLFPASAAPVLLRLIGMPLKLLPVAGCRGLLLLQLALLLPEKLLLAPPFQANLFKFALNFCQALAF